MARLLVAGWFGLVLAGCSPQQLLVRQAADALAGQDQAGEDDLALAREAAAYHLKLSEVVLRRTPGHLKLAEATAGGFAQYAYAFVAFEADRIESRDTRAATALRERAARLYLRAQRHALTALELHQPGLRRALQAPAEPFLLDAEACGAAYWGAAAWGGHISLSKDRPETVADLPQAIRLAQLAWQRCPDHGDGALASLMGTFEAARPGGSGAQAAAYFDRAIQLGQGRSAGAFVAKAEAIVQPAGDRPAFEVLLQQALATADARRDLANEVMRERARWLLDHADDLF